MTTYIESIHSISHAVGVRAKPRKRVSAAVDTDTSPSSPKRDEGFDNLYPFASHFLECDGVKMHYVDEGSGPTLLLLHGNPTWSFYYRDLIKNLRDEYRVIAPDHVGCGFSDKPQNYPYTLSTHITNIERLVEHLNLRDVTMLVHDWGGPIGFGWAMRHASLLKRMVVFNSTAFLTGKMPLRIRVCGLPILGSALVRGMNAFSRASLLMAIRQPKRMTPQIRRGYLMPYDNFANRIAVWRFIRDIPLGPSVPSYELLQRMGTEIGQFQDRPMMIFWGGNDFCFNDVFLAEWKRRFPQATIHRYADAGHYVVEDAHERILPALRDFLADTA